MDTVWTWIKLSVEFILGVLFPPKFPRIKNDRERWESWIYRESPNLHPELDPFAPELRRWESWTGNKKTRPLTSAEWRERRARKLDV